MLTPNLPKKLLYKRIPVRLNESDFIQFVIPYLSNGSRFGPKQKISSYKMFNYISYVMHTGCQWYSRPTRTAMMTVSLTGRRTPSARIL